MVRKKPVLQRSPDLQEHFPESGTSRGKGPEVCVTLMYLINMKEATVISAEQVRKRLVWDKSDTWVEPDHIELV